ncbi:hypothetical protein L2Y96_06120 [Luteibacter aegosomaticola]|uniref:hypothetical protein n=1 Tax=Luteibacter aegosomaticola TaxID=2911538 RepID=UPI001FFB9A87|nr:hypothetical protein [Luteibacter aegosomaticola]UPG91346.1 hypothetical protein L2Y96_06120 [Luteibacter aegosomaticola]
MNLRPLALPLLVAALCAPTASRAADAFDCTMRFDLSSWAVLYKHSAGHGTITCTDGSTLKVKLTANGGGLALSKSAIKDGKADFSGLARIEDTLGTYASADADTGIVKHGDAQVLTKGPVSMTLAGAGKGMGLGVTVGGFTIAREP